MRIQTKCTRAQRAADYLKRVAALTGAKQDDDGTYHLTAGICISWWTVNSYVLFPRAPNPRAFLADLDMPSAEVACAAR